MVVLSPKYLADGGQCGRRYIELLQYHNNSEFLFTDCHGVGEGGTVYGLIILS